MSDVREGSVWAVVAAAGESRRMGLPEGESKQFLLLGGEPVLCHSVRRLLAVPAVAGVVCRPAPLAHRAFRQRAPLPRGG